MDEQRASELVTQFRDLKIAVVGDLMLDRYVVGSAKRISYEAPVPVVRVQQRWAALGGAANVLRNLSALGVRPLAFGVVGNDIHGDEFCRLCEEWKICSDHVVRMGNRQTTIKTRVIADNQQVARVDDECCDPIPDATAGEMTDALVAAMANGEVDAVIIEDYDKGVVTPGVVEVIREAATKYHIPTSLDPHPASRVVVPGTTLMTPNRSESFALAGEYYRDTVLPIADDAALHHVANKLAQRWEPENLLITLGAGGMALFRKDGSWNHIPTVAREVFDVSGAGDTVIAVCTAAILAGASALEACELANHAGGVVVAKVGTVPVDPAELLASFRR